MQEKKSFRSGRTTGTISVNPHRCVACWKCVEHCPKGVLGKVEVLWHRHVKIVNPDACIGCGKCMKVCSQEVFTPVGKTRPVLWTNVLLLLLFVATIQTGVGAHLSGHQGVARFPELWKMVHTVVSFGFLVVVWRHLWRYGGGHKALWGFSGRRKRLSIWVLTVALGIACVMGCLLWQPAEFGVTAPVAGWHGKASLLFSVFAIFHAVGRMRGPFGGKR